MKNIKIIIFAIALTVIEARAQPATNLIMQAEPSTQPPAATADEVAKLKQELSALRDRQKRSVESPQPRTRSKIQNPARAGRRKSENQILR